jgi:hypothetical protein
MGQSVKRLLSRHHSCSQLHHFYHFGHALVAQQGLHSGGQEHQTADRLVDEELAAFHGLCPHLRGRTQTQASDTLLCSGDTAEIEDRTLLIAVFKDCADVSISTTFVPDATELVVLKDPSSLMPVITAVMLMSLDQSLDCIEHSDEAELASMLRSISIWFETKSMVVPSGWRLPSRGNPIEDSSVWLLSDATSSHCGCSRICLTHKPRVNRG